MAKIKGFGGLGNLFGVKSQPTPPPPKKNPPSKKSSAAEVATAPYNFVTLPEKVLPAPIDDLQDLAAYMASNELFSGEILLDIEALTPLFIGGNGSKNFAPTGTPIIPGSTLRGMFKNIFKIVTCGAFRGQSTTQKKGEDFNDEHIYFRCLMKNNHAERADGYNWSRDLNDLYKSRMIHNERGKPVKNARPGFLIGTSDNRYFIAPSIYKSDRKDDRILILDYEAKYRTTIAERNSSCVKWDGKRAYIITGSQARWKLLTQKQYDKLNGNDKKRAGKQFIRYTSLDYVDWSREHWLELFDDVQNSYRHDRNRRGVDLFKDAGILQRDELERLTGKTLPDIKTLIPCHFLEEGGQVTAFGHGQCFRIPYQKSIGAAVKISGNDALDFADLVFGTQALASRVYFEDATPKNFSELQEATAHPLMQPNPTSYQLYLRQGGKQLNHWDTHGAQIRGYKLYWHNATDAWHATKEELALDEGKPADKRLTKEMKPLDAGSKFTAKIRFKNLTAIELGALMMIFDLNGLTTAAYKIGQGKPFGFGSVKIKPTLFIEDAYDELFDADGWKNPCREDKPADYLDAFKKYLQACGVEKSWRDVMAELGKILDWKNKPAPNKIKSMSGDVSGGSVDDRFIKRVPLPTIAEVLK